VREQERAIEVKLNLDPVCYINIRAYILIISFIKGAQNPRGYTESDFLYEYTNNVVHDVIKCHT